MEPTDLSHLTPEHIITSWGSLENCRREYRQLAAEARARLNHEEAAYCEVKAAHVASMINLRNMRRREKEQAKQIRIDQERRQREMNHIFRQLRLF
jgi:hypothetical protein